MSTLSPDGAAPGNTTVSVVLPTYNRCRFLPEALESIFKQTRVPDEVIVVDDGSTDATPELLRSYGDRIRCIRIENGGKAAAVNGAIPQVFGSHIWIFDDDDVALPDALATQLRYLAGHGDVDFTYSSKYRTHDRAIWKRESWVLEQAPNLPPEKLFLELLHGMFMTMQGMLIPKQCLIDVGMFDATLVRAQDYDLVLRLAARFRGGCVARPTFVYREHAGPRGTGAQWRSRKQQDAQILAYTQAVLRKARDTWPLAHYVAGRTQLAASTLTDAERGEALFRRACVMLRKGLLREALEDLNAGMVKLRNGDTGSRPLRTELALAVSADPLACAHPYRMLLAVGSVLERNGGRSLLPALAHGAWWALRRSLRTRAWGEMRVAAGMLVLALLRHPRSVFAAPAPWRP